MAKYYIDKGVGTIEAEQFHGARIGQDTLEWIKSFPIGVCFRGCGDSKFPHVHTMNNAIVDLIDGDFVIAERDKKHFRSCKPEIFKSLYTLVVEE